MIRRCSVEGCYAKHLARGLCPLHYGRMWRNGTTELLPRTGRFPRPQTNAIGAEIIGPRAAFPPCPECGSRDHLLSVCQNGDYVCLNIAHRPVRVTRPRPGLARPSQDAAASANPQPAASHPLSPGSPATPQPRELAGAIT